MDGRVGKPPEGVVLSPLAHRAFAVLAEYTVFPWPVLFAQAKRIGVDPAKLSAADLRELVPLLAEGVERFTSPEKGRAVRARLETLI